MKATLVESSSSPAFSLPLPLLLGCCLSLPLVFSFDSSFSFFEASRLAKHHSSRSRHTTKCTNLLLWIRRRCFLGLVLLGELRFTFPFALCYKSTIRFAMLAGKALVMKKTYGFFKRWEGLTKINSVSWNAQKKREAYRGVYEHDYLLVTQTPQGDSWFLWNLLSLQ